MGITLLFISIFFYFITNKHIPLGCEKKNKKKLFHFLRGTYIFCYTLILIFFSIYISEPNTLFVCVSKFVRFEDLQLILDEHCFKQNKSAEDPKAWSKFDFVYLPMDYG